MFSLHGAGLKSIANICVVFNELKAKAYSALRLMVIDS